MLYHPIAYIRLKTTPFLFALAVSLSVAISPARAGIAQFSTVKSAFFSQQSDAQPTSTFASNISVGVTPTNAGEYTSGTLTYSGLGSPAVLLNEGVNFGWF